MAFLKPLNIIVIGHVNSGKSTLIGHLLHVLAGAEIKLNLSTRHSISTKANNNGPNFAWLLDEESIERERGMTLDYHVKHLIFENRCFTFIDAPGHSELVSYALKGAILADIALLVIDSTNYSNDSFILQPQTIEHSKLIRSLGITQMIITINKIDKLKFQKEIYNNIVKNLKDFLTCSEVGFSNKNLKFIPISALQGINLVESTNNSELISWWKGQSLLSILKDIQSSDYNDSPLRLGIADTWTTSKGDIAAGKVASGVIHVGDNVLISPFTSTAICQSLTVNNTKVTSCESGQYIDYIVLENLQEKLFPGCVLCTPNSPLDISNVINAKIIVFSISNLLIPGQNLFMQLHNNFQPCFISKINSILDKKTGSSTPNKPPRFLKKNDMALVEITCENSICFALKNSNSPILMSRVILRRGNITVAAGVVSDFI